jgi:hypothetical protein
MSWTTIKSQSVCLCAVLVSISSAHSAAVLIRAAATRIHSINNIKHPQAKPSQAKQRMNQSIVAATVQYVLCRNNSSTANCINSLENFSAFGSSHGGRRHGTQQRLATGHACGGPQRTSILVRGIVGVGVTSSVGVVAVAVIAIVGRLCTGDWIKAAILFQYFRAHGMEIFTACTTTMFLVKLRHGHLSRGFGQFHEVTRFNRIELRHALRFGVVHAVHDALLHGTLQILEKQFQTFAGRVGPINVFHGDFRAATRLGVLALSDHTGTGGCGVLVNGAQEYSFASSATNGSRRAGDRS